MGSQMVELKWTNHKSNIASGLQELYLNDALLDVTIACGEFSLRAHKTVLSASSSFFQKLFLNNPCKHPIIIMTDVDFGDLKTIVEFMYQGEIHISREKLTRFLKIADRLKIKGLADVEGIKANQCEHSPDVHSQYPYNAWEHSISYIHSQMNTQANDAHNNARKVTDCVQNEEDQEISTVQRTRNIKLECDLLHPTNNSCAHWQSEYYNQTSGVLSDGTSCTTDVLDQPLIPSASHQLSLPHQLPPPASNENRVPMNNEEYPYSRSQTDDRVVDQVQEEDTRRDIISMNHYQSQDQSSTLTASTNTFGTAESLSFQSSSHNGKIVNEDFIGSSIPFTTAGNSSHNGEGNFDTFGDFSCKKQEISFNCEVCRSSFLKEEELVRHKQLHSKPKNFVCEICNTSLSSESSLQRHLKMIHSGEKQFYCKICHKQFSSKSGFEYHKRTHTGEKPFRCKMCAKKFPSKGGLRCHIRKHNGEKPFTCKVCHKQFFWQSSWQCHENTHNVQKQL